MSHDSESSNRPNEMEAVKTTIVGGRPPGSGKAVGAIPRGIEVLIKKAAVDPQFRELLLSRRAAAADEIGLTLTPAEKMMLDAAPAEQLARIIGQTKVDPAARPALLGRVAAGMLLALGLTGAMGTTGCPPFSYGVTAERIPPQPPPATDTPSPAGVMPDRPAVQPTEDFGMSKGLRPDYPRQSGQHDADVRPGEFAMPPATQPATEMRHYVTTGMGVDRPPVPTPPATEPADIQADDGPREFAGVRPGMQPSPATPPASQPATTQPAAAVDPAVRDRVDRLIVLLEPKPAMPMAGVAPQTELTPQEAESALILMGPPALPVLREKLESGELPAESAVRVKRIIATIEKNADAAARPPVVGEPWRPPPRGGRHSLGLSPDRP